MRFSTVTADNTHAERNIIEYVLEERYGVDRGLSEHD